MFQKQFPLWRLQQIENNCILSGHRLSAATLAFSAGAGGQQDFEPLGLRGETAPCTNNATGEMNSARHVSPVHSSTKGKEMHSAKRGEVKLFIYAH